MGRAEKIQRPGPAGEVELTRRGEDGKKDKGKGRGEDAVVARAPKGPNPLPRFCNLCKVFGHSDLTYHLQGNAPTPGPSNFRKPYKHVFQRTPRSGLGAPKGTTGGSDQKGKDKGKGRIMFKKEESELESELEVKTKMDPERGREGVNKGEEKEKMRDDMAQEKGRGLASDTGPGEKKEGETETLRIHLGNCRAPPTATAKGKELEWKKVLRNGVEAALRKADTDAVLRSWEHRTTSAEGMRRW